MSGEMSEQITPKVPGNCNESEARDPPGEPPKQVVAGDQRDQQQKPHPDMDVARCNSPGQAVDKKLDGKLRPYGAADGSDHRRHNNSMRDRPRPHVTHHEWERTIGIPTAIFHAESDPPFRLRMYCNAGIDIRFRRGTG